MADLAHLRAIVHDYQGRGFRVAIDDFGAGHSGLNLLADLRPDVVKLDMFLVRDIDGDNTRQVICKGILQICRELGMEVIAEGVETSDELHCLQDIGVHLVQGYYLAKPSFESLAQINPGALASPRDDQPS